VRPVAGAKAQPGRTPTQHNSNLNKFKNVYITSNKIWCIGRADFVNSLHAHGGDGVKSGGLHKLLNNNHYQKRGATWHQTIEQNMPRVDTSFVQNLPINDFHAINCHLSIWTCHIIVRPLPRHHPYGLYGLYSQHNCFCLFDDSNRSRYLTHLTSI
jgi:hypothetical protein